MKQWACPFKESNWYMKHKRENLNKEIKDTKNHQTATLELKNNNWYSNTVSKLNRIEQTETRISKLVDRGKEIIQSEQQEENKLKKIHRVLGEL